MKIKIKSSFPEIEKFDGGQVEINDLFLWGTKNNCSDIFIRVGERPYANRYGQIIPLNCQPIDSLDWDEWADHAINSESNAIYVRNKTFDFAHSYSGFRYRVNVGYAGGLNILTARMINPIPPKFKENGGNIAYPEGAKAALKDSLSNGKGGLIIFGAPTGNGKTTTLGACINSWEGNNKPLANTNIITLEDPIEYFYNSKESTRIVQKELGRDFLSFDMGIRSAMREHPTHMLIGELRDRETIRAGIEAGRTGHTILSTLHTRDIPTTVSRLIDNFSGSLADGADLISNISLVICQRLVPRSDLNGYVLEVEYLVFDHKIKNLLCDALRNASNMENIVNSYISSNINNKFICGREKQE